MFDFPAYILRNQRPGMNERRAKAAWMEQPYDETDTSPSHSNPRFTTPPSALPIMEPPADPQFFDLMAGNVLGADPRPVAGYGGGMPELVPPGFAGVKTPLRSVPAPTMGPDLLNPRPWAAATPPPISYRDALLAAKPAPTPEQFFGPEQLAPVQPKTVQRTFGGSSGETVYDMTPDYGAYTGSGSFRGIRFNNKDEEQAAMDRWHAAQGQRETGIAGSRSLEQIMNETLKGVQFPGLDGGLNAKRMAAIGMQQQMTNPLAALERERMASDADVKRAELMRKDAVSNKMLEAALFHSSQLGPDATPAQRQKVFEDTLRVGESTLTPGVRSRLGPLAPVNEADEVRKQARNADLRAIFSPRIGEGGASLPFQPSMESARSLVELLANSDDAGRAALQRDIAAKASAYPGLLDELVRVGASDLTQAGLDGNFEGQYIDKKYGLPFNLAQEGGFLRDIRRIPNMARNNPEAMYDTAVLPNGKTVYLPPSIMKSWASRTGMNAQERAALESRIKALNPLLRELLNVKE